MMFAYRGMTLLILVLAVFASTQSFSSMEGWITSATGEFDSNASAVVGREVQLPCDITPPTPDDRTHLVLWYKQDSGNPIYTKDMRSNQSVAPAVQLAKNDIRFRVSYHQGSHFASPYLLVKDVKPEDQGLYRCRVDFKKARSRNSHVHLNIIVPPQVPSILDEKGLDLDTRIGPYNEGSSLFLSCEVVGGQPPPQVTWWRDGKLLDDSYEVTSLAIVRNDLMVRSLTRDDFEAIFTCRASNNNLTEPVTSSVTIDMNLKPLEVVILAVKEKVLHAKKQYQLICRTSGARPPPLIAWWKNGRRLKQSEETVSDDKNITTSALIFNPTAEDHEITLSCQAENPAIPGSHLESSWTLNVQYAPVVSLSPGESIRLSDVREGDDVYLECTIRANPWVVRVEWRFQGKLLPSNANDGVIVNNQTLILQKVKQRHSGDYSCLATNTEGEGESQPIRLQVKHPPVCIPGQKSVFHVAMDETVRIECKVDAFPINVKFNWKWNKSGEFGEEIPLQMEVEEQTTVINSLTFTPRGEQDYGNLYCWAINDAGHQKMPCIFTLVPAGPPDPVNNCSVINQTQTVINVSCKSGYDGGLPQNFICEVIKADNTNSKRSLSSSVPLCLVDDLSPGVNYVISIYAANHKGRSQALSLSIETLKNEHNHSTERFTTILGIIIGIIITLVFITIAVLLVMKVKTSKHANLKTVDKSEESCSAPLRKDVDDNTENEGKSPDIICNTNVLEQDIPNNKIYNVEKWAHEADSHCENCLRPQRLTTFTGCIHTDHLPPGSRTITGAGGSHPNRKIQPVQDFRQPNIREHELHCLQLDGEESRKKSTQTCV